MSEVLIQVKNDDELEEIFKNKDFISIEELREELVKLYNDLKRMYSEEDNEDLYEDYKLGLN